MKENELRLLRKGEKAYCLDQSPRIREKTGFLGRLEAKAGSGQEGLRTWWKGCAGGGKEEACRQEAERLADLLLYGDPGGDGIAGRELLAGCCFVRKEDRRVDPHRYRFRTDTGKHAYLMDLRQFASGLYLLDCRCYEKALLDRHLRLAARGIRFTDASGRERFVLPDGGRIRVAFPDGRARTEVCRYVDAWHAEIGSGPMNLFDLWEFAELADREGFSVEPLDRMPAGKKGAGQ
jgi:hypothetical protein